MRSTQQPSGLWKGQRRETHTEGDRAELGRVCETVFSLCRCPVVGGCPMGVSETALRLGPWGALPAGRSPVQRLDRRCGRQGC